MSNFPRPRHIKIGLVTLAWLLAAPLAQAATDDATFRVSAAIDKESLKTDFYKVNGGFYIDTTVTNASDHDQTVVAWTQYGWSWLTNGKGAPAPGTEALANAPQTLTLKPGQHYDRKVEMWADPHAAKPVHFKLGFVPRPEAPASGNPGRTDAWGGVFWSADLTLAPARP